MNEWDELTLTFTARWHDTGMGWARLQIGPYVAEAWNGGEWTVRVNGRAVMDAPAFKGGTLESAKAASVAWIRAEHATKQAAA